MKVTMVDQKTVKSKTKLVASLKANRPSFYIGIQEKDSHVVAYSTAGSVTELFGGETKHKEKPPEITQPENPNFRELFLSFNSTMALYRTFIPVTLTLAPILSIVMGPNKIRDFAISKGKKRDDISRDDKTIYELDLDCFREFTIHKNEAASAAEGVRHLPEVMIIGLISCYDAFLSRLLKVVLNIHQEIILTSEKSIKYSDLKDYASIEDARQAIIDKEVESVIRESHHEHFTWMEKKFSVKLREGLSIWPQFLEICERRNLLTHTGGMVSEQYISIGKSQNFDLENITIGQKLHVDTDYFSKAVNIIYEIGIKLTYVLWKKFLKSESKEADKFLNELCFDLIFREAYPLAESLLSFATKIPARGMDERTRLMLVINYANAVRLQGKKEQARLILNTEDWSACALVYQISVASVNEDISTVIKLMKVIGKDGNPNAEDYRQWPVFREVSNSVQFTEVYEDIFGTPFIRSSTSKVGAPPSTLKKNGVKSPPTKH